MLKIVAIMLGGILTGYLLRNKRLSFVSKLIMLTIWILLFLLGVAVGNNDEIIRNLDTIGLQAFILSLAAVVGSSLLALLVYRLFFKSPPPTDTPL